MSRCMSASMGLIRFSAISFPRSILRDELHLISRQRLGIIKIEALNTVYGVFNAPKVGCLILASKYVTISGGERVT